MCSFSHSRMHLRDPPSAIMRSRMLKRPNLEEDVANATIASTYYHPHNTKVFLR